MMPISVLILTFNEENNIGNCIDALKWCDDILVLDSYSKDKTQQISLEKGAKFYQRRFDDFATQRNYAIDNLKFKNEWILHLDADEIVTNEFKKELFSVINNKKFEAYRAPSKLMFLDKWLRFSGMYPTYQVRFGLKNSLRFKAVGHGQREDLIPEKVGTLKKAYLHYNFSKGFEEWYEKHNRYSTLEALYELQHSENLLDIIKQVFSIEASNRRRGLKLLSMYLPAKPFIRFIYMYFFRLGFLDGSAGFRYCLMIMSYEFMILLKKIEFKSNERN
jgi:glycosyltransferase involved in cell wall biosynthesis